MAVTDTRPSAPRPGRQSGAPASVGRSGSGARPRAGVSVRPAPVLENHKAGSGIRTLYGVLALILVGYAISLIVRGPNGAFPTWLDGWGVAAFELLASVLILARAYISPRDRKFALWLGLGACAWAIGDFAMTAETLGGATPATISLANDLWAGFFPLAYVGVMVLMERDVRKLTAANYLDGVVAALVTSAALVAFAFRTIAAPPAAATNRWRSTSYTRSGTSCCSV